ncbi:hypothetical protein IWW38_001098 [Coemansia aciculifera]|uniref:Uncharacterized protein n=1 Tax=Coemansia aciculifera TaxID=417176 RepID=A0ACC1M8X6_9FUNG|nr:hypothetical protein IWW38_001098 [Coemansia aciculifera]
MVGLINVFKLATSAGNSLEQAIRPGERFTGTLTLDIPRPMQATQVVLEFTAMERRLSEAPGSSNAPAKFTKTAMFTCTNLVLWKAQQKGVTASTVLSDGTHVYSFSCQMPHINYPQTVKRAEYEVVFVMEGKVLAPKDNGECVVAVVERELFFTPFVASLSSRPAGTAVAAVNQEASVVVETLCFEKKGKKGKPAIELRAALSSRAVVPGTKLKLDVSVKELTSANWTKVVARLFERAVCHETKGTDVVVWSADLELANADVVRSSVYNFFLTDEILGATAPNSDGVSEHLVFPIPRVSCSPLSSEHIEFTHFLRIQVYVPGWLSSDRSVYVDVPVQLMTGSEQSSTVAASSNSAMLHASIASIERSRHVEPDEASIVSGRSTGSSVRRQSTAERLSMAMTLSSLPPRYCDIPAAQRPAPTLALAKHGDASSAGDQQQQQQQSQPRVSQSTTRHTTLSSVQSMEYKSLISGLSIADDTTTSGEEKYRSRPLPTAPGGGGGPPPLPAMPMPTSGPMRAMEPLLSSDLQSYSEIQKSQHGLVAGNPFSSMTSDTSSPDSFPKMQRQSSAGSTGGNHPRTPISLAHNDSMNVEGATSDDDAGYFKSSIAKKSLERERGSEKGLFRLRKNSSIRQVR